MNNPSLTPQFEQVLHDFKKDLCHQDVENFKFTSLKDLQRAIIDIQNEQASSKRMKNLNRMASFIEAIKQFDDVVKIFTNSSEMVAFVWGPVKFLLQVASTHVEALNALLATYEEVGDNLPLLRQYEEVFKSNPRLHRVLGLVYQDIMEFHRSAIRYFRGPAWKKVFNAVWKTFRTKFDSIILNLQRHQQLLANQASLEHFQQYQEDRARHDAEYRRIQDDEQRRRAHEVARWLNPADSNGDQDRACSVKSSHPGTGQWLMEEDLVKRWTSSSATASPFLWITGKPGAGKTVLASSLVEHFQSLQSTKVVFFYSKYNDPARDNYLAVLRGVLAQLVRSNSDLQAHVFELAASSGSITLEDPKLAFDLLEVALSAISETVYLILDGLDECSRSAKDPIVKFCRVSAERINQSNRGAFRCCIFSQHDMDTGKLLKGFPTLRMTTEHNRNDIAAFCQSVSQNIQEEFELSQDEMRKLASSVSEKADGMFIYASLVMRNLTNQPTRKALRREIDEIPEDLDALYERILNRVLYDLKSNDCKAAKKLLGWLASSLRPLRWHEIQCAVSYDSEDHSFDLEEGKLRKDPKQLCGSFVDIHSDNELRLVHQTAASFLRRNVLSANEQDLGLACLCLRYLCLDAFQHDISHAQLTHFLMQGHYAFMDYALVSWPTHLQNAITRKPPPQSEDVEILRMSLERFFKEHPTPEAASGNAGKSTRIALSLFEEDCFYKQLMHSLGAVGQTTYRRSGRELPMHSEPLEVSLIEHACRIRDAIENAIESESIERKRTLRTLYGFNVYKCPQDRCRGFYEGFLAKDERKQHFARHERSYACTVYGCPASYTGFATAEELRRHVKNHSPSGDEETFPWSPKDDVYQELMGGNREAFDIWLSQFDGFIPTIEIWEHSPVSGPVCKGALLAAIKLDDVDLLKKILDHSILALLSSSQGRNSASRSPAITMVRTAITSKSDSVSDELLSRCWEHLMPQHILPLFEKAANLQSNQVALRLLEHPHCNVRAGGSRRTRYDQYLPSCIRYGNTWLLRHVLDRYNPDLNGGYGDLRETPLAIAAKYDQVGAAKVLLETGKCNKKLSTRGGLIAERALNKGDLEFLELLYPKDPPEDSEWYWNTRFLIAVRDGDAATAWSFLRDEKVSLENLDRLMHTPLIIAIKNGHHDIVEHLLSLRVDFSVTRVLAKDRTMATPLELAIKTRNRAIVRLILQRSNRLEEELGVCRRFHWESPPRILDLARDWGDQEILQLIEDACSLPEYYLSESSTGPLLTEEYGVGGGRSDLATTGESSAELMTADPHYNPDFVQSNDGVLDDSQSFQLDLDEDFLAAFTDT